MGPIWVLSAPCTLLSGAVLRKNVWQDTIMPFQLVLPTAKMCPSCRRDNFTGDDHSKDWSIWNLDDIMYWVMEMYRPEHLIMNEHISRAGKCSAMQEFGSQNINSLLSSDTIWCHRTWLNWFRKWLHRWCLGMDKEFHPTCYNGCNYLSMLGLKLIHIGENGLRLLDMTNWQVTHDVVNLYKWWNALETLWHFSSLRKNSHGVWYDLEIYRLEALITWH